MESACSKMEQALIFSELQMSIWFKNLIYLKLNIYFVGDNKFQGGWVLKYNFLNIKYYIYLYILNITRDGNFVDLIKKF